MDHQRRTSPRILFWVVLFGPAIALACQFFTPTRQPTPPPAVVITAVVPPSTPVSFPSRVEVISEEQLLVDLYKRVNPSIVNITVYQTLNDISEAFGQGSGFVFDGLGHIVTNAHVVHGADGVEVTFADGLTRSAAIVGEDLHSDLAVVEVELPEGIGPLPFGNLESLEVGQTVVAIGNPFGLQGTLTRGIISALGRTIPALTIFRIPQAIQTDAAINPGNSGGPLLNLNGEVIGVNAQIQTDDGNNSNSGVGFAIPVSILERVVPSLIENGSYEWPYLGVRGSDVVPALVQAMKLPVERGAYLWEVTAGGPSAKAGLRGADETVTVEERQVDIGGDVVTAIDGNPVNSFDDLLVYVALQTIPGQTVTLTIIRDGEYRDVTVKLEPRPTE